MHKRSIISRAARLTLASSLAFAGWAHAGECPAGKSAANALANAPSAPVGVTDTELASVDLSTENVKLDQRRLRLRHMTIAPGGIVPLHSHEDRPALICLICAAAYLVVFVMMCLRVKEGDYPPPELPPMADLPPLGASRCRGTLSEADSAARAIEDWVIRPMARAIAPVKRRRGILREKAG